MNNKETKNEIAIIEMGKDITTIKRRIIRIEDTIKKIESDIQYLYRYKTDIQ